MKALELLVVRFCNVIILNTPNPAAFHIAIGFSLLHVISSTTVSLSQQVNAAICFNITRMNQPLKAISVIKMALREQLRFVYFLSQCMCCS